MSFSHFAKVIFGLADLWCAGAAPGEQVVFLHCLVHSASHEAANGGDALVHFLMLRTVLSIPGLCGQLGGLPLVMGMHNAVTPLDLYVEHYRPGWRDEHGTEELEEACREAAWSILALCKRADGLPGGPEEVSQLMLQSSTMVTHHEALGWWLCGEVQPRFGYFAGEHPDALMNHEQLTHVVASFWSPHHIQSPDEREWLPPDPATPSTPVSPAYLNAVAAIRSAATLLATCRSAPMSRQGPIARRLSIRATTPASPFGRFDAGQGVYPGRMEGGFRGPLMTSPAQRCGQTFAATIKYDVPPLPRHDFDTLRDASGGLIQTQACPPTRTRWIEL